MRTEDEIKARIKELEDMMSPEELDEEDYSEDECYLDEGQQSELQTLYWVLGDNT